jgi:VWFA-related protein
MRHSSRFLSTLAVLVTSVLLAAYLNVTAAPQTPAKDNIKVQAAEVVIDAIVTDRHNRMVTNLTADDFVVYEDGVPQKVTSFHLHKGEPAAAKEPQPAATPTAPAAPTPPPAAPAQPPALSILLLDYSSVEVQNQKLVREASAKYVRDHMQPNDRIAVFTLSSSLHPLTNFTDDRDAILSALKNTDAHGSAVAAERADLNEGIANGGTPFATSGVTAPTVTSGPGAASAGAGMGSAGSAAAEAMALRRIAAQYAALRSALDREQTREVLLAIRAIAQGVKHIDGRKSLLLFSQGFVISQVLWPELQSTVDAANRAQLAIYSVDAHGLETRALSSSLVQRDEFTAALGPSENEHNPLAQQERMKATGGEDMFDRVSQVGHDLPESSLRYLANTTGGFLIYNTNDPSTGLAHVSEEMRTYYTLSYRPTNQNFDGKFRQIKVELKVSQLNVRARGGYYAMPAGFESLSPEEYQLVAQWKAEDPSAAHVPLYLRAGAFRETGTDYRVPVILEIPTAEVRFEKHGDINQARFQILGLVRDTRNTLTTRFGGRTQLTATNAEYQVLSAGNLSFLETLYLPEGSAYSFEVLVKDLLSGKVLHGTYGIYLREPDRDLGLSTVLLAREAEKTTGASGQFLTVGNVKILPSARCQFKNGDNLIFYFDVYNPELQADKKSDLTLEVFLLQNGQPIDLKLPAYRLSQPVNETLPRVTVARYVQLAGLSAGDYSLVVNVRDAVAGKSQTAHAAFTVVN